MSKKIQNNFGEKNLLNLHFSLKFLIQIPILMYDTHKLFQYPIGHMYLLVIDYNQFL